MYTCACGEVGSTTHICPLLSRPTTGIGSGVGFGPAIVMGSCSLCGGRVTVPGEWMGASPFVPTCESCGARARDSYGPVIDMVKA